MLLLSKLLRLKLTIVIEIAAMFSACWDKLLGEALRKVDPLPCTHVPTVPTVPTVPCAPKESISSDTNKLALSREIMRAILATVWDKKFVLITKDDSLFRGQDPIAYMSFLSDHAETTRMCFIRRRDPTSKATLGVAFYVARFTFTLTKETCDILCEGMTDDKGTKRPRQDVALLIPKDCQKTRRQKRPSRRSRSPRLEDFRTNKHVADILMDA